MTNDLNGDFKAVTVCTNPVFLIGAARSGTTALALSLGKHSRLSYGDEGHFLYGLFGDERIDDVFDSVNDLQGWVRRHGVTKEEFTEYVAHGVNAMLTSRSEGKRWLEKAPINTLMVERLAEMFPQAYFLHLLRDGRQVVRSMMSFLDHPNAYFQERRRRDDFVAPQWAVDFGFACRTWRQYVTEAMHFAERHPERCLTVVNEQLVADASSGFRAIYDFIGVPYEEEPIVYFQSNQINSSFRRNPGHLGHLLHRADPWRDWTLEEKTVFLIETGETMVEAGYLGDEDLAQMKAELQQDTAGSVWS